MSTHNDGGQAFPCLELNGDGQQEMTCPGMTLRDYLAAHASDADVLAQAELIRAETGRETGISILPDDWRSKARYMHADEMLKAREA